MKKIDWSGIRVISWDLDGTLYSLRRMKLYLCWLFLRKGAGRDVRALYSYRKQIDLIRSLGGHLGNLPWNQRAYGNELARKWYGPAIRYAGPRTHACELLTTFQRMNYPQVVYSDFEADYKLKALGLLNHFSHIYVGEHFDCIKPNPEGLRRIASDFEISPAHLLHIGDRMETDGEAAKKAGCQYLMLGTAGLPACIRTFHN